MQKKYKGDLKEMTEVQSKYKGNMKEIQRKYDGNRKEMRFIFLVSTKTK